jgi:hypothetical protein
MMKLLMISLTYRIPQNRVSDTITLYVTLNTIDGVVTVSQMIETFFCAGCVQTHAKRTL